MAITKVSRGLLNTGVSDSSDATAITIDSSENVGIGTTSPSAKLHIATADSTTFSASNSSWHTQVIKNDTGAASNASGLAFYTSANDYHVNAGTGIACVKNGTNSDYGANLVFITRPQSAVAEERMRIDSGGSVYFRKTAHAFATAGVEFLDSNITNMTNASNSVLNLHRTGSNGTILEFFKDSGSVGSISTNTNSLPSDRNFKRDISNLNLGLNLVSKLKPSQYNYIVDDEDCPKMYGLIAQDLEESLTEVGIEKNSTWLLQHKPNDDEKQSEYSLDYTKLIPILINSIQEQQVIIEGLKSRIETLEG